MSQYLEHMEEYSLFDFLNPCQAEQSQFSSISLQPSFSSPNSLQPTSKEQQSQMAKKELPTTDQPHKKGQRLSETPFPSSKQREDSINCPAEVGEANNLIRQGTKDDTMELNINFKTILFNYFRQLMQANELSAHETQLVLLFGKRSPSFKSLIQFCDPMAGGKTVNELCMAFISSSLILRRIMESRCKMGTKLQMIKFVERLRQNIGCGRIVKWKTQTAK